MLTYRAARPDDLPFIVELIIEDSVVVTEDRAEDAMGDDYRAALAAIDADPNEEMWIVERDGVAVGCFQLSFLPGLMRRGMWRGQIELVHVADGARNLGIGSQMMHWALDRCRAKGCGMVQLTSNKKRTDAHRFYERLGFARSHEGFKYYL